MVVRTTCFVSEELCPKKGRSRLTVVLSSAAAVNGYVSAEDVFGIL